MDNVDFNEVALVGRCGRDPDIKYFESGKCNAKFSVAVNAAKKDAPPTWFNVEFWGKTAEIVANYVKKGSLIGVTGSLGFESWSDRTTGDERRKPVIKGDRLELLGSKQDTQQNSNSGGYDDDFT